MKKIEKLAKNKFNGDVEKAMAYMMDNFDKDAQGEFIKEFSAEDESLLFKVMKAGIDKRYPGGLKGLDREALTMATLSYSVDEVISAEKNPFGKNLLNVVIRLIITILLAIGVPHISDALGINITRETYNLIFSAMTGVLSISCAKELISFCRFRRMHKLYNSKKYKGKLEQTKKELEQYEHLSMKEIEERGLLD